MSYYVLSLLTNWHGYDVIIPGNHSEIHSWVAIDVTRPETKSYVDSISITMFLNLICEIESV